MPVWQGEGFQRLEFSGAARYSKYNLFSGDTVFSLGTNWARLHVEGPVSDPADDTRDVTVRLNQATLALTVNELPSP